MMGVADFPIETLKALRIHPDSRSGSGDKASKKSAEQTRSSQYTTSTASSTSERRSEEVSSREGALSTTPTSLSDSTITSRATTQDRLPLSPLEQTASQGSERSPLSSPRVLSPVTSQDNNNHHRSLLGSALGDGRRRSGSNSRSHSRTSSPSRHRPFCPSSPGRERSHSRGPSVDPAERLDTIMHTGKGVQRIVGAGIKSPMDFSMNIARGFHNAPKLYGDETVRQHEKITDLQSGLKAAGKVSQEFHVEPFQSRLIPTISRNLVMVSMTVSRGW